jgi:hypothetical protein
MGLRGIKNDAVDRVRRVDEPTREGLLTVLKQAQRNQDWSMVGLAVSLLTGEAVPFESMGYSEPEGEGHLRESDRVIARLQDIVSQDQERSKLVSRCYDERAYRAEALVDWIKELRRFLRAEVTNIVYDNALRVCSFHLAYDVHSYWLTYKWEEKRDAFYSGSYSGIWRETCRKTKKESV